MLLPNKLVQFAQYQFNLSELYKLRQKIYENKGTFTDITFETIIWPNRKELIEQNGIASKTTNLGQDERQTYRS
jgi:hypothetical protein